MSANISQQEMNKQQRVVKDYMDIHNKITAGPSVNTTSARINEFPTRHPTASYTSSNLERNKLLEENEKKTEGTVTAKINFPTNCS
jgi:hypothetical protein